MKKKLTRARKRFGQHFLSDQSVIDRIVAKAGITANDHIIEIGPGRGALTERLISFQAALTVVEIDRDLARELSEKYESVPGFRMIAEDVLKLDWQDIFIPGRRNLLVANLPYNISTPVLFRIIAQRKQLASIIIMVQKEVAMRIEHKGDGKKLKDYGVLSVIANNVFDTVRLFDVPPEAFFPRPKVSSSVIQLVPKNSSLEEEEHFFDFVRRAFNHRRKLLITHLRNNESVLYQNLSDAERSRLELLRPENLTPEQYRRLFYENSYPG